MLVLSARVHERIAFPTFHTAIQLLDIKTGTVRLGIEAPDEVRVLRESIPDRVSEWGPAPLPSAESLPASLCQLNQLVNRRLDIAKKGLAELREHLASGRAQDAETIVEKLDEDLHLLRRRLHREVETAALLSATFYGASAVSQSN